MGDRVLTVQIVELIRPGIEALGYELWGCELQGQGKHTILRVYIDTETGVTLDDCSRVSNQISGILDIEDLIHGKYDLEVSSPGLDRLLFKEEHFRKFIGNQVKIKLRVPVQGRRNYIGVIKDVELNKVSILVEGNIVAVPIENVDKARIVPKF